MRETASCATFSIGRLFTGMMFSSPRERRASMSFFPSTMSMPSSSPSRTL